MKYFGTEIIPMKGDFVRLGDDNYLEVEEIIKGKKAQEFWGLSEDGLMLKGGSYDLLFVDINDSDLEFLRRKSEDTY